MLLDYLPLIRLKFLLITFGVGAGVMAVYARLKVRNGVWLGFPDLVSSVFVVTLGSLVFNALTALTNFKGK